MITNNNRSTFLLFKHKYTIKLDVLNPNLFNTLKEYWHTIIATKLTISINRSCILICLIMASLKDLQIIHLIY